MSCAILLAKSESPGQRLPSTLDFAHPRKRSGQPASPRRPWERTPTSHRELRRAAQCPRAQASKQASEQTNKQSQRGSPLSRKSHSFRKSPAAAGKNHDASLPSPVQEEGMGGIHTEWEAARRCSDYARSHVWGESQELVEQTRVPQSVSHHYPSRWIWTRPAPRGLGWVPGRASSFVPCVCQICRAVVDIASCVTAGSKG
jgi:hypothetical protein